MNNLSKEQIEELKKKHGEVYLIEVDGKSCLVRKPTRKDLSYSMVVSEGGKDIVKMQEAYLNSMWLEGDEEIRTDDSLFFAVSEQVMQIIEKKQATLKKL